MSDDDVVLSYVDSLWIDNCEIALYRTDDPRFSATPWGACWVRPDKSEVRAFAVTKDRALLRLLRELDIYTRNKHLQTPVAEQ